jgi:hypothetical protein
MATLYQKIAERFLAKLGESKDFDGEKVDQLRKLLGAEDKKIKSEDFVKVFAAPAGGDIK